MNPEGLDHKLNEIFRRLERIEARLGIVQFSRFGPGTWSDSFIPPPQEEEPLPAATPVVEEEETPVNWIDIELLDDFGEPCAGERYVIVLPNGEEIEGRLDSKGKARVNNIEQPGECKVTFPDLDADDVEKRY